MKRLSSLSKSAFWSQFLLGLVAILTLPAVSSVETQPVESVAEQQIIRLVELTSAKAEAELSLFHTQEPLALTIPPKQAVEFCEFLAKSYRLLVETLPPIRAGPTV